MSSLTAALLSLEPFGALAVLAGLSAGLMPRRALILGFSTLCSVLFCVHFLRLGSNTGAVMCLISAFQSLVALRITEGGRPAWVEHCFAASSAAAVALTAATYAGPASLMAGAGALLATAARLQADAQRMRILLLACAMVWLGHNALVGSIFGMTCDLLSIAGLSLALWRHGRATLATGPAALPRA